MPSQNLIRVTNTRKNKIGFCSVYISVLGIISYVHIVILLVIINYVNTNAIKNEQLIYISRKKLINLWAINIISNILVLIKRMQFLKYLSIIINRAVLMNKRCTYLDNSILFESCYFMFVNDYEIY